jgi:hypothetical protein
MALDVAKLAALLTAARELRDFPSYAAIKDEVLKELAHTEAELVEAAKKAAEHHETARSRK